MRTQQLQRLCLVLAVLVGWCHARARDPRDVDLGKVEGPPASSPLAQLLRSSPTHQSLSYPAALSGAAGLGLRVAGKYRLREDHEAPRDVTQQAGTEEAPSYSAPEAAHYQAAPQVTYPSQQVPNYSSQEVPNYVTPSQEVSSYSSQEAPSYSSQEVSSYSSQEAPSYSSQEVSSYPSQEAPNYPASSLQQFSVGPGLPAAQGFHLGGHVESQDQVQGRYQVHHEPEHEVEEKGSKDAKYEFVYRVKDHSYKPVLSGHGHGGEGSDFGHSEARNGERTWGRYFVKLPDGRVQTVRYWADHSGYHAEVQFQGKAHHPELHKRPLGNHHKQLEPTYAAALPRDNSEEYAGESSAER